MHYLVMKRQLRYRLVMQMHGINQAELLKHKGQDAEAETCFTKVKELEGE